MDENSEVHMETDVSSTTDDVPENQEVTGSHGDVEMVIVVEKVDEDSSIDEHPLGADVTSASPQKVSLRLPHKIPKTPVKAKTLSETLMPPKKYESSKPLDKNSQVSTGNITSPEKQQPESSDSSIKIDTKISKSLNKDPQVLVTNKTSPVKPQPESTDSSNISKAMNKTSQICVTNKISPVKQQPESSSISNISKSVNKDSQVSLTNKSSPVTLLLERSNTLTTNVTNSSPEKNAPVGSSPNKIFPNSPFKDGKVITRSPIKLIRIREIPPSKEGNTQKSPAKTIQDEEKEVNSQQTIKQVKSPEKPLKNSQENLNNLESLHENSPTKKGEVLEKTKEKSPTKDNLVKQAPTGMKMVASSVIESNPDGQSNTQEKLLDPTKVQSKEASTSDNSNSKSKDTDLIQRQEGSTDNASGKSILIDDSSISGSESMKTVNGDDKIDSLTLPADDILVTNSNDSQSLSSDVTEKEHNKSISRELKSLINSAKESKIISECTQLKSKTRKSRQLDTSNTSLNVSIEADKMGNRRSSTNSLVSNCSEISDRSSLKRSMRSQNPEFVNKCKQFLNSVTSRVTDTEEPMSEDEGSTHSKEKTETKDDSSTPKKKKVDLSKMDIRNKDGTRTDFHCWRCHWTVEQDDNDKAHPPLRCTVCPRSFHFKCLSAIERKNSPEKKWVCPDCLQILQAEGSDTRSPAMKKTSLGMLCDLLKYALERMMDLNGVEPFMNPVDRTLFPDYDKYVVHPMDLSQMKRNIADGLYGSTEAFVADAQWILHNSIIFNTLQSKLTGGARALVRSCRSEMTEIEACPECYAGAHARKPTWFTDVCTTPHILLWAKLKGFPYWPAKGMTVNSAGLVDVRFFGAHDRAWVPAKDCFLFSEKDPNNFRNKRQDIIDSMKEAEQHIRNISRKYGKFVYPPFKTPFDPSVLTEQLKMMIPSFEGELKLPMKEKAASASPLTTAKEKRRSASKGSKSSANDDGSESEDTSTSARTEACPRDKESDNEKAAKVESNVTLTHVIDHMVTRKRRRSNLEEAVMTFVDTGTTEKKKRIDGRERSMDRKKTDTPEQRKKSDSTEKKKSDSTEHKKKRDSIEQKKQEQEPSSSKEEKAQLITKEMESAESSSKKKTDTSRRKSKDEEPSSSSIEEQESLRVTPIKLVALPRTNKQTPKMFAASKVPSKPGTPKEEDKTPQKKSTRSEKASTCEKPDKTRAEKRRNSRANKSLNSAGTSKTPKTEKKPDNDTKELRPREKKSKDADSERPPSENSLLKPTNHREVKERLQFDDDTSLAVIAQKRKPNSDGLPTISNVCSLSTTANASTSRTTTVTVAKTVAVDAGNSSVFTPTSTDNVRSMKDAVTKLQKLRDNTEPLVGRVGVRAFARMTSPERTDNVQVEIKAEPVDLDDEDRHNEKMDLMNACKLQPVNPPQSLRDVRINRVVLGPSFVVKSGKVEARARAKKTFPAPRRAEDGRSELNGKNTMVYIPIQPPATQAPVRAVRPALPVSRPAAPSASGNNTVNTMTTPLKPSTSTSTTVAVCGQSLPTVVQSLPTVVQSLPTVGQVPTAVHTVPLMTSVNGQWMFSLQPIMSVGGVDGATAPIVNGLSERATPTILPIAATTPTSAGSGGCSTPAPQKNNDTPAELPRLQQRPPLQNPLDPNIKEVAAPTPSSAGPLSAKLNKNSVKLADFFRNLLEDCIETLDDQNATAAALRKKLEQTCWKHQQEVEELKHNHELTLAEMRLSFEKEKHRVMTDTKRTAQLELERAVKQAKSKQWCANCSLEAQFYCCWNTAYCDHPCQRAHWPKHYATCAQRLKDGGNQNSSKPRLQTFSSLSPSVLGAAPPLTRGYTSPEPTPTHQGNIIVNMVEEGTGRSVMKCVAPYNPGLPPLILNNPVLKDDNLTSGGFLIVGSTGGNTTSVITPSPSRRPISLTGLPPQLPPKLQ